VLFVRRCSWVGFWELQKWFRHGSEVVYDNVHAIYHAPRNVEEAVERNANTVRLSYPLFARDGNILLFRSGLALRYKTVLLIHSKHQFLPHTTIGR
jgi:hypothetical protein